MDKDKINPFDSLPQPEIPAGLRMRILAAIDDADNRQVKFLANIYRIGISAGIAASFTSLVFFVKSALSNGFSTVLRTAVESIGSIPTSDVIMAIIEYLPVEGLALTLFALTLLTLFVYLYLKISRPDFITKDFNYD